MSYLILNNPIIFQLYAFNNNINLMLNLPIFRMGLNKTRNMGSYNVTLYLNNVRSIIL